MQLSQREVAARLALVPPSERIAVKSASEPWLWVSKALFTFNLSTRAYAAYMALAYYRHNGTGTIENLTLRTLAGRVGVAEKTMKRGLAELEKKGAITIRHRSKKSTAGNRIPLANLHTLIDLDEKLRGGDPI